MPSVRPAAVAGTFYPADPGELRALVERLLEEAEERPSLPGRLAALIVPHAGYDYSGPIAATAYRLLAKHRGGIRRVALIGPCHRVDFEGLALSADDSFGGPLGPLEIDKTLKDRASRAPGFQILPTAHQAEHSLEVQIPFLQVVLPGIPFLPVLVRAGDPDRVAEAMAMLSTDEGTLVLVSTDLSHFESNAAARAMDRRTADGILSLKKEVAPRSACGAAALGGLLALAASRAWRITELDLRNSSQTSRHPDRVVGYGAFALWAPA